MDKGKGFISKEDLKKIFNFKLKIIFSLVTIGVCFIAFFVLFIVATHQDFFAIGTSAQMTGLSSSIDDDDTTEELSKLYDLHEYNKDENNDGEIDHIYIDETAEENNFFQEVIRQRQIWVDDYAGFGIAHNEGNPFLVIKDFQNNDLDVIKQLVPIHYQGNVYVSSLSMDFDDPQDKIQIKPDGTLLNEYEGEKLVNNRDSRDFYEQAKERLGSTFFIYPGVREMFGNSISLKVTWDAVKAVYHVSSDGTYIDDIRNIMFILSDYSILASMSLKDENEYKDYKESYPKGPSHNLDYFIRALDDGYNGCIGLNSKEKNWQNWTWINTCNDYKLLFEEVEYLGDYNTHITSKGQLQAMINDAVTEMSPLKHAIFPVYEVDKEGKVQHNFHDDMKAVMDTNPAPDSIVTGFQYFIIVNVERYYNEDLYEKYMKDIYIPYLYINCESCKNKNSSNKSSIAEQIYDDMQRMEKTYRYYNDEGLMQLGGNIIGNINNGVANIEGADYNCSNNAMPNLATYTGHKGVDINNVPIGTNVYPLFTGKVTSISRYDYNCYPKGNSVVGYTCSHCGSNGYGNKVVVTGKAANGIEYNVIYAHLNEINVAVGQDVSMDTVIGTVGNTGCSTGAHLHLELRKTSDNSVVYATQIYNNSAVQSVLCSRSIKENV